MPPQGRGDRFPVASGLGTCLTKGYQLVHPLNYLSLVSKQLQQRLFMNSWVD